MIDKAVRLDVALWDVGEHYVLEHYAWNLKIL